MATERNQPTAVKKPQSSLSLPLIFVRPWKPPNKKLFEKLINYFPDQDENLIKNLMYKHKEVEHEIISALVESSKPGQAGTRPNDASTSKTKADSSGLDTNGVIMKLRYLKYLFPTCDEIDIYHLLYCNDLDIQRVIADVEKRGHKKADIDEVLKNRKSQTQVLKAQKSAAKAKAKAPAFDSIEAHKRRTKPALAEARVNTLKDSLRKKFEQVPDALLLKALEAADYNETLAVKFLEEMKQAPDELYRQRYEIKYDKGPDVILYPCKGVQNDGKNYAPITSTDHVAIAREIVECNHALALLKVDASTFTQDDFDSPRFSHAKGRQEDLATGSNFRTLHDSTRERCSLRKGAKEDLRNGSKYDFFCQDESRKVSKDLASGRNKTLTNGSNTELRCGRNLNLIVRTHPFFMEPKQCH